MKTTNELETDFTDGRWIVTTMGQFIQILVDCGQDPAVIFRVEEDTRVNDKSFIRRFTVYSIPNGSVGQMCHDMHIVNSDIHAIYKGLARLMEAGLVT